ERHVELVGVDHLLEAGGEIAELAEELVGVGRLLCQILRRRSAGDELGLEVDALLGIARLSRGHAPSHGWVAAVKWSNDHTTETRRHRGPRTRRLQRRLQGASHGDHAATDGNQEGSSAPGATEVA